MEALEDQEDPVIALGRDPDPDIAHRELPEAVRTPCADMGPERMVQRAGHDCVVDQVREELRKLGRVGQDPRHRVVRDHRLCLAERDDEAALHACEDVRFGLCRRMIGEIALDTAIDTVAREGGRGPLRR